MKGGVLGSLGYWGTTLVLSSIIFLNLTSKSITVGLSFTDSNHSENTFSELEFPFSKAKAAAYSLLPPRTRDMAFSAPFKIEPVRFFKKIAHSILWHI